jgi:hypothetical protein
VPELIFNIPTSELLRFKGNLIGQFRAMRDAAFFAIDESADIAIDEMKKRIEESDPTGRTYWHRGDFKLSEKPMSGGIQHIASARGQPPAILSGELLNSFSKRTMFSRGHTRIIAYIENHAKQAEWMEYGTPRTGWGKGIDPRPFMAPVMYDPEILHRMLMRVRRVMKAAGQGFGAR